MKSEEIKYRNATFWAASNELDNAKCREFTLFEDATLLKPVVIENEIMMIKKLSSEEAVLEWGGGGAGYAVWGGGSGRNFGNPSMGRSFYGRGFGFGSSNSGSGAQAMYTYEVKPLNQTLEPHSPNTDDGMKSIHIGSVVKGKLLKKKKHIIGQVQSIKQDSYGDILYYVVRDPDTAQSHNIDPTSIFIWEPENEGPHPGAADVLSTSGISTSKKANEGFYPRLMEFKQGGDPYNTMKIGKTSSYSIIKWFETWAPDADYNIDANLNIDVRGHLNLINTPITSLPDNLTVGGSLYIANTPITSLPDNLTVGRDIYMQYTKITSLPDNLTVGGIILKDF